MTNALFFDGKSTAPCAVRLEAQDGFLSIVAATWSRLEVARTVRFSLAYAHAPARIDLADGALCEVRDAAVFCALRLALAGAPGRVERMENSWWSALGAALLVMLVFAAGYQWGVPLLAEAIVEHAPRSFDQRLGAGALESLQRFNLVGPERPLTPREAILAQRFALLSAPLKVPYHLVFRSFRGGPNAFALPDGTILVSTEIEALSSDNDALLFVMAHELGHLHFRHSMKSLARNTMTSVILSWYVGDASQALAVATTGVVNLSYSRRAEAQADDFAIQLLRANQISTRPAAQLFRALEALAAQQRAAARPPNGANAKSTPARIAPHIPSYLNSHPATEDRIRALEAAS